MSGPLWAIGDDPGAPQVLALGTIQPWRETMSWSLKMWRNTLRLKRDKEDEILRRRAAGCKCIKQARLEWYRLQYLSNYLTERVTR